MDYPKILNVINAHKKILENFSYVSLLQIFILLAPLITYPYLIRVVGRELYGLVITAQVLVSYATIIIDFGSNKVCAKHVSQNRDDKTKLSEIVCSVLWVRSILWLLCFIIYILLIYAIPTYRQYFMLFFLTYFLTLNDLLFPQYFFQGIEMMKTVSLINIATKLFFICMVFVFVSSHKDYLWIPSLYAIGYTLSGIVSLYIIFISMGLKVVMPKYSKMKNYVKDSMPILATDLICAIKDKLNYMFVGTYIGMSDVVVYDLGFKLNSVLDKPTQIITMVMFPRFAINRNMKKLRRTMLISFLICLFIVVMMNIFLSQIVYFFIHETIDIIPIRLLLLCPLVLSVSSLICNLYFIAFGYNKYVLYSIIVTTIAYFCLLLLIFASNNIGNLYSFVFLALFTYLVEFIYRAYKAKSVFNKNYN